MSSGPPTRSFLRLEAMARLVRRGSSVADVGTDHGLLPWILLRDRRARHCIATELKDMGWRNLAPEARDLIAAGRLDLIHGDGLAPLVSGSRDSPPEVITIGGLGARTLIAILERDRLRELGSPRLVLQPQRDPQRVRHWIGRQGYRIEDERMVRESGRFYTVIAARPEDAASAEPVAGHPDGGADESSSRQGDLTRAELWYAGPCLVRSGDPLVREYWSGQLAHWTRVASAVAVPAAARARRRAELARRILRALPPRLEPGGDDATTRFSYNPASRSEVVWRRVPSHTP